MKRLSFFLLLAVALGAWTSSTPDAATLHFALSKSEPAADSKGPPPNLVKLWFTQEPQQNSMSIRVLDASGEPVKHTGEAMRDREDGKLFTVQFATAPAAGSYTVAWRAIGQDGHVVRGDFAFTVEAQ